MDKKEPTIAEEQMLATAKAFHKALLDIDVEGGIAAILMLTVNYCREKGLNPIMVSKTIAETIEEHIDEIRKGVV